MRSFRTSSLSGWVLVRSLNFDGVTPATSMSLGDAVTGDSFTAALSTTTGWSAGSGGIRFAPGTARGADLDFNLDDLLGASWQDAAVLALWHVTSTTQTGNAAMIPALVASHLGASDVYLDFKAAGWTVNSPSGGATGSATATAQRVLGMRLYPTGVTFSASTTTDDEPAGLTELGRGFYARNSASALAGIKLRVAFNEPVSTLDATVRRLKVYVRHGL